jgi:glycosyltransferase involved in cell wall biosynthesis
MNNIDVLIPTYNYLGRDNNLICLITTLLNKNNISYINSIIIIDNGVTINEELKRKLYIDNKIQIVIESKIGLNFARNSGIAQSESEIIAYLDDDTWVSENWAKNIFNGFSEKEILCVGGPVFFKDFDKVQIPIWFTNYFHRFLLPPSFPEYAGVLREPYFIIGANMSFRRKCFVEYGYFDPGLDRKGHNLLSSGDTEFIARLPQDLVWYEPEAKVFCQFKTDRFSKRFMIRRIYWQGISDYLFVKKVGLNNFYDKNEVIFSQALVKFLISKLKERKYFELICAIIRIIGFRAGILYSYLQK